MKFGCTLCVALLCLTPLASAAILNGDFASGDFTSWTVSDVNGVANASVEPFDVSGSGASNAARFQVGRVGWPFGPMGGGLLSQLIVIDNDGDYSLTAKLAVSMNSSTPATTNAHGATFELLLDSIVLDSVAFGVIESGQTKRDELRFEGALIGGSHSLGIRIRRDYAASAESPMQYVDDILLAPLASDSAASFSSVAATPEPASMLLLGTTLVGLVIVKRKREMRRGR